MLLDDWLPDYHFSEAHFTVVRADNAAVLSAIRNVTPSEIRLFRLLFALRSLPALPLGRRELPFHGRGTLLEQMLANGFVVLGEDDGRELVLAAAGQFWKVGGGLVPLKTASEFAALMRPGYARAAINFRLEERRAGGGTTLRTETRVSVQDPRGCRKFWAYWQVIRPASGFIRKEWLAAIKRRAEQMESRAPASPS